MNIASQRRLQADLDEIFRGQPVSESNYDDVIPKLFASMAGAVLNEELRLLAPVTGLPKCTPKHSPQNLKIAGKTCTVPAHCYIILATPAIHRNPKQWQLVLLQILISRPTHFLIWITTLKNSSPKGGY